MPFSSWRGIVGHDQSDHAPRRDRGVIRLLPPGIGLTPKPVIDRYNTLVAPPRN